MFFVIARNIWTSFLLNMLIPDFFNLNVYNWCKQNTKVTIRSSYIPWNVIFAFTIWAIQLRCNSLIFTRKMIPHQILRINSISHATEFYFLNTLPLLPSTTTTNMMIRWCPAPFPYIIINTDRSSKGNLGLASASGLAQSDIGAQLWGFSLNLVLANNTMVELWGIREALCQAWNKGHRWVLLQTDSLLATKWLNACVDYPIEFSNLEMENKWLFNQEWEAHVEHVWREANNCVDLLAKRGVSQSEKEILYDTCPIFFWKCLYQDFMGFVSSRRNCGCQ